jgi:hypothetical protein
VNGIIYAGTSRDYRAHECAESHEIPGRSSKDVRIRCIRRVRYRQFASMERTVRSAYHDDVVELLGNMRGEVCRAEALYNVEHDFGLQWELNDVHRVGVVRFAGPEIIDTER